MIWKGINVVVGAGHGLSLQREDLSSESVVAQTACDAFKKRNQQFLDAPWFGEFSVGYVF